MQVVPGVDEHGTRVAAESIHKPHGWPGQLISLEIGQPSPLPDDGLVEGVTSTDDADVRLVPATVAD